MCQHSKWLEETLKQTLDALSLKLGQPFDAGADIKQTKDVITIQNENISIAVTRLKGNGANRSRLIDRIQQLGTIQKFK